MVTIARSILAFVAWTILGVPDSINLTFHFVPKFIEALSHKQNNPTRLNPFVHSKAFRRFDFQPSAHDRICKLNCRRAATNVSCADLAFLENSQHSVLDLICGGAFVNMTKH